VGFVHGLRGETGSAVARVQRPRIQILEVVGTESAQRHGAECRQHVAFDVAAVAVVGAVGEHESLAGQPTGRQIDTEGHRPRRVVASVLFAGESGGETFGVGADGAGGMPTPSFPPGDRVEPLVDHGVPGRPCGPHTPSSQFLLGPRVQPGRRIGRSERSQARTPCGTPVTRKQSVTGAGRSPEPTPTGGQSGCWDGRPRQRRCRARHEGRSRAAPAATTP
jgi:hypothetical protein